MTVDSLTFRITADTKILDEAEAPFPFERLAVGDTVAIEGVAVLDAEGNIRALFARRIQLHDGAEEAGRKIEVKGYIAALGDRTLTVASRSLDGLTFLVTTDTEIIDEDRNPIPFDSLALQDQVTVVGEYVHTDALGDSTLLALRIKVEKGGGGEIHEVEIAGTITALAERTVTVDSLTFFVIARTEIVDERRQPVPFDSLAVGDDVKVRGAYILNDAGDRALVALLIIVKSDDGGGGGKERIRMRGVITALSDTTVTVDSLTFAVTDSTEVFGLDKRPIPFDSLAVGDFVYVEGLVMAARMRDRRTFIALRIEQRERKDQPEIKEYVGHITRRSNTVLVVDRTPFWITDDTKFFEPGRQPDSLPIAE